LLSTNRPGARISVGVSATLPRLGLSALFLCLFSGLVLIFYYRPMGNVFQNVEEITTLVPYGWFFRQLHFASGQLFVILMLIHAVDHFHRRRYRLYPVGQWQRLIFSLCLCFYTLFTGFILKGDKESFFAARIFMNIAGNIPMVGEPLSRLFILPGENLFFLPYLYHCFFLPILILYLIRTHPWFFLGIQSLLKTLPVTLAGIIFPALFLGCVLILPYVEKAGGKSGFKKSRLRIVSRGLHWLIVLIFLLYAFLTLKAAFWEP